MAARRFFLVHTVDVTVGEATVQALELIGDHDPGAEDGISMAAQWERSDDGVTWQPWMDMAFTRS